MRTYCSIWFLNLEVASVAFSCTSCAIVDMFVFWGGVCALLNSTVVIVEGSEGVAHSLFPRTFSQTV